MTFDQQLAAYKKSIDDDIALYTRTILDQTSKTYGKEALIAVEPYLSILGAGGKRIRGVLVLVGYAMMGRKPTDLAIIQAARAVEMMHAYILIIDDIQDKSLTRRGIDTAHVAAAKKARGLKGDIDHVGVSFALNGALIGAHAANAILANLELPDELKIKVLSIMNHTMLVTAHGQTHDILSQSSSEPWEEEQIYKILQWKTAHYTILNPLHVGMVLAGAGCEDTNAITDYALHIGKAFQIADDLLLFSTDAQAGKAVISDIQEGKQTLLTAYVYKHGTSEQKNTLMRIWGNPQINKKDIASCIAIFKDVGALEYAQALADDHVTKALDCLDQHAQRWQPEQVAFLEGLARYISNRSH